MHPDVGAVAIARAKVKHPQNRYADSNDSSKQILLNIGSIGVGIAIRILALPNNKYVTGLKVTTC
jgi:hypothetical protein